MSQPPISVLFTPEFQKEVKALSKRYRCIKSDLQPVLDEISAGKLPGDPIENLGAKSDGTAFRVYKVRLANRDAQRGKSGGYRLIYDATDVDPVVLVLIYSKSDRDTIKTSEIREVLQRIADR